MLAGSGLSPVWNYSFHSYSPAKSEYSILPETEYGEHKFVFKVRERAASVSFLRLGCSDELRTNTDECSRT